MGIEVKLYFRKNIQLLTASLSVVNIISVDGIMMRLEMHKINFDRTMTSALKETGFPSWDRKKRVSKEREARLVTTIEVRDVFKEIANRGNTNLQTVLWLAAHELWKILDYSRSDYNQLMFHDKLDAMTERDRRQIAKYIADAGIFDGLAQPKSEDEIRALEAEAEQRLTKLNPAQQRQLVELMEKKGLIG